VDGANYNFGELVFPPSSLSGFVYLDANNNGIKEDGEAGLAGFELRLTGTDDLGRTINRTTSTDGGGHYQFDNLRPAGASSSYTITVTQQPDHYVPGKIAAGSAGGTTGTNEVGAIGLGVGVNGINYNFGELPLPPSSLAGFVYLDGNNDGIKEDNEAGIAGMQVTLISRDASGVTSIIARATTGADGGYRFSNLRSGTYTIAVTQQPERYVPGQIAAGSAGGTVGTDQVGAIGLGVGVNGVNYNFGELPLPPSSLAGFVYLDGNNDGIKEDNESGIAGMQVTLTSKDASGTTNTIAQTITGADGGYRFGNLRPGTYTITVTQQPERYVPGKISVGSVGGVVGPNQIAAISVGVGLNGLDYNFGELLPPNPTGLVYSDSFGATDVTLVRPPDFSLLSKLRYLSSSGQPELDPVLRAEATYVDGLYRSLLNRPADATGLLGWVVQIHTGALSHAGLVHTLWTSAEHRGFEVDRLYATFLHRKADAAGRSIWVNALLAGTSEADVARMLVTSAEYQASHPDNTAFITGLYAEVLGRTATPSEMAAWNQALQNGLSRQAAVMAFLTSSESYQRILDCDYRNFLHRAADGAGKQAWLAGLLNARTTPQSVGEAFLSSEEFFNLTKRVSMS
jgi:hypothetical protein